MTQLLPVVVATEVLYDRLYRCFGGRRTLETWIPALYMHNVLSVEMKSQLYICVFVFTPTCLLLIAGPY